MPSCDRARTALKSGSPRVVVTGSFTCTFPAAMLSPRAYGRDGDRSVASPGIDHARLRNHFGNPVGKDFEGDVTVRNRLDEFARV